MRLWVVGCYIVAYADNLARFILVSFGMAIPDIAASCTKGEPAPREPLMKFLIGRAIARAAALRLQFG
jgi:hypothetical protein